LLLVADSRHLRLNEIIIHNPELPKVGIAIAVVLGEAKMEARFEPVGVGPSWIVHLVGAVSEPARIWFRDVELVVGNNAHSWSHGGKRFGLSSREVGSGCRQGRDDLSNRRSVVERNGALYDAFFLKADSDDCEINVFYSVSGEMLCRQPKAIKGIAIAQLKIFRDGSWWHRNSAEKD
jgi:hypothetical protein